MAHLASSPPVRRTRSRSRSQDSSNYSLDLDALMPPEDDSEIMTPPRRNYIDVVHSEDIDGPTDFTQNLEYWMTAKLPNVTRPSRMTGQAKDDLEDYVSEQTETKSPVREAEKKDSLLDTETPRKEGEGLSFLSNIPSSLHAEDAQSSTPKTVEHVPTGKHKEFQASVEDYEGTPSRMQESSSAIGATLRSPEFTLKSRPDYFQRDSQDDHMESETVRNLREALIKLRDELNDVRLHSEQELGRVRLTYEQQAEEQKRSQAADLQAQEIEWERRLSSARLQHEHELNTAQTSAETRDMSSLQHELKSTKEESLVKNEKMALLEQTVAQQGEDLQLAKSRMTTLEQERDAAIENHQAMLATQRDTQRLSLAEAQGWQAEREALRKSNQQAEQELATARAEISNLTLEHANEIDELTSRVEDAANATQVAILQEQRASQATIEQLEAENSRLHRQLDNKDDELDALKDELQQLRIKNIATVDEKDKLATKLREQKTLNDQAAREIQSLRSGNKILQAKLAEAENKDIVDVETLESQLAEANAARLEADAEVDELKAQFADLQSSLSVSKAEAVSVREELARHKEDAVLVNKVMDKRIRELMRAREGEWAKRLEALKTDLGFRGEVLMREWGKAEMGVSEPQGYRYKYV